MDATVLRSVDLYQNIVALVLNGEGVDKPVNTSQSQASMWHDLI